MSKPISELVLQSVVRNRTVRGAVQLTFRFQPRHELNKIGEPRIFLHLQWKMTEWFCQMWMSYMRANPTFQSTRAGSSFCKQRSQCCCQSSKNSFDFLCAVHFVQSYTKVKSRYSLKQREGKSASCFIGFVAKLMPLKFVKQFFLCNSGYHWIAFKETSHLVNVYVFLLDPFTGMWKLLPSCEQEKIFFVFIAGKRVKYRETKR